MLADEVRPIGDGRPLSYFAARKPLTAVRSPTFAVVLLLRSLPFIIVHRLFAVVLLLRSLPFIIVHRLLLWYCS